MGSGGAELPARCLHEGEEDMEERLWRLEKMEGRECKIAQVQGKGSVFIDTC
jgi:hypothetical protein